MEQPYADFLRRFEDKHLLWTQKQSDNAVVLVEGNCRWQVPLVLRNFRHFLGDDWNLYIFCTSYNQKWLVQQLDGCQYKMAVVDTPRIDTAVFNRLYKDINFWNTLHEEHILTIQADCVCCKPLEDKWFKYDMVGAPCGVDTMNGGLSLRKKSAMVRMLQMYGAFADSEENEDVFFTKCLRSSGATIPNGYDAAFFAVESYYFGQPFGVHGTDKAYHSISLAQKIVDRIDIT